MAKSVVKPKLKKPNLAKAMKGNSNGVSTGLYHGALSQEEKELWSGLSLDNLDEEIKVQRVRLRRAIVLEAEQKKNLSSPKTEMKAMFMKKIIRGLGPDGATFTKEREAKDFGAEIDRIVKQLNSLITLRIQVIKGTFEEQDIDERVNAMNQAGKDLQKLFTLAKD